MLNPTCNTRVSPYAKGVIRALLVGAALCLNAGRGFAQISATPVIVRMSVTDSTDVAVVHVRNDSQKQSQMRFYLGDFEQVEGGEYTFKPFGSTKGTCGSRITVLPDGAVLKPGEQQDIQVRLASGFGACWAMVFVESAPEGTGPVKLVQRIGVRVINSPKTLDRDANVETVTVPRITADSVDVATGLRNTGKAPLELRGRVEIRDFSGTVLGTTEFGPMGLLPSQMRKINVTVAAKLAPGKYLAVPIIDFGGEFLAGGQVEFTVIKP